MSDMVNHPRHYQRTPDPLLAHVRGALLDDVDYINMECFDAMVNMLRNVDQIRGYLRGNSFKYRWRYEDKAGVEDLRKAKWYERKLEKLEDAVREYFTPKPELALEELF